MGLLLRTIRPPMSLRTPPVPWQEQSLPRLLSHIWAQRMPGDYLLKLRDTEAAGQEAVTIHKKKALEDRLFSLLGGRKKDIGPSQSPPQAQASGSAEAWTRCVMLCLENSPLGLPGSQSILRRALCCILLVCHQNTQDS